MPPRVSGNMRSSPRDLKTQSTISTSLRTLTVFVFINRAPCLQQLSMRTQRSTLTISPFHISVIPYQSRNAQNEVKYITGSEGPHLPLSNLGILDSDTRLLPLEKLLTHGRSLVVQRSFWTGLPLLRRYLGRTWALSVEEVSMLFGRQGVVVRLAFIQV